ncbi:MAG: NADH-quinone oxidoreductase subunit N [SAR324 cluster bacterium]|nr:NADH-quinone oxidoreductase subunit N [SAR324 cluster bacterium]MCZ6844228.1 NADH-quinone oxidoreductase subunit N [SAR324 cluster bacterium]
MTNPFTTIDFLAVLPEIIIAVMGMVVIVIELFGTGRDTRNLAYLSLLSLIVAGYVDVLLLGRNLEGFWGTVSADDYSIAFELIFLTVSGLTVLISIRYLEDRLLRHGEYYALLLFATVGMMLLASGLDLLLIFIGLEILSISSYILCGMIQADPRSNEAALKYFLLGAFATGFLLYGIAMLYGATGSIELREINAELAKEDTFKNPYIWIGLGFILVGFGFKIALVPFHMWTPDVYEGAPTAVTAFLSTGPKAAGFAALIRILFEGLGATQAEWSQVLWVLAALTMTVGNVVALQQDNIKRMLAYSSIAHAGYILVAVVAGGPEGLAAVLFYTFAYTLMNFGAFAILILASSKDRERVTFSDYAGYGFVSPVLGIAMLVFMLSLAGIPLTAGFAGKFQIFKTVIDKGFIWLAVIGLLNSVVSIYYYLRLVVMMYMQSPTADSIKERSAPSMSLYAAIALTLLGVIYLGIFPSRWIELSLQSVSVLVAGG